MAQLKAVQQKLKESKESLSELSDGTHVCVCVCVCVLPVMFSTGKDILVPLTSSVSKPLSIMPSLVINLFFFCYFSLTLDL